ncbi:MAG: carboxypeptidase regulatory-like domain-containing protein [Anaerolineales bacterium]|nr:carboxypeptidase regulatory-like domain-containing protein [Anaerolineales bacterium]
MGCSVCGIAAALSDLLPAPQPIATPSLRHSDDKHLDDLLAHTAHWVELPDAANNVLIRVGAGATQEAQTTIVLKLTTLSPATPLEHGRVSLRDADGDLLERVAADADGLVLFQHLPGGKYRLTVEQANRQWDVNVFIEESALSL